MCSCFILFERRKDLKGGSRKRSCVTFFPPLVALRPPPVADKGSKSAVQNKELKECAPSAPHNDYILDGNLVRGVAIHRSHKQGRCFRSDDTYSSATSLKQEYTLCAPVLFYLNGEGLDGSVAPFM